MSDLIIAATWEIVCHRCANSDTCDSDQYSVAEGHFVDAGWEVIDGFQMCPACIETDSAR